MNERKELALILMYKLDIPLSRVKKELGVTQVELEKMMTIIGIDTLDSICEEFTVEEIIRNWTHGDECFVDYKIYKMASKHIPIKVIAKELNKTQIETRELIENSKEIDDLNNDFRSRIIDLEDILKDIRVNVRERDIDSFRANRQALEEELEHIKEDRW